MNPLIASLVLAVTPVYKADVPINVERMIEAVIEIEGGHWGDAGGAGCMKYIAWEQHRAHLSYRLSASKEHAMPVYREHILWLMFNIPRNHMKLTPAAIYTCWHHGLDGGVLMMRAGQRPEDSVRCQNLYEESETKAKL